MKKSMKLVVMLLAAALALPAGFAVYAEVSGSTTQQSPEDSVAYVTEKSIPIAQEVLDKIKLADAANYDRNVAAYKKLLVTLHVLPSLKKEIEKLVMEGYALPEIMIGYEFLYHSFGTVADMRDFVERQAGGETWNNIFIAYDRSHPGFQPRSFDSAYLEKLMNLPYMGTDDIMIADRLSFVSGKRFEDIVGEKQAAAHWNVIAAKSGILFGADELPRVQIKSEHMQQLRAQTGLSEEKITEAFVIAAKTGEKLEDVVFQMDAGDSAEAIFAASYENKYR